MATKLTEDEIDDILYCARANELNELRDYVAALSAKYPDNSAARVVVEAVDTNTENNALHYAGANGHLEIAKYVLSLFASSEPSQKSVVNLQNHSGNTPLHWAALNGHLDVVKVLLKAGADVSILNKAGYDAVFEAEMNDKGAVVDWLLKEGEGVDSGLGGSQEYEAMAEVEDADVGAEDVANGVGKMELESSVEGKGVKEKDGV